MFVEFGSAFAHKLDCTFMRCMKTTRAEFATIECELNISKPMSKSLCWIYEAISTSNGSMKKIHGLDLKTLTGGLFINRTLALIPRRNLTLFIAMWYDFLSPILPTKWRSWDAISFAPKTKQQPKNSNHFNRNAAPSYNGQVTAAVK